VAALVKELKVFLVELDRLHAVAGPKALVELCSVDDVLELDLVVRAALARFDCLGLDRQPQGALMLDHGARADFVSGNLRHESLPRGGRWCSSVNEKERGASSSARSGHATRFRRGR